MPFVGTRPKPPIANSVTRSGEVHALYDQCLAYEKELVRPEQYKQLFVRELAFGGEVFDSFSSQKDSSPIPAAELAIKYSRLEARFRDAKSADERLRLLAKWLRAALDVQPEDSLGEENAARLSMEAVKRVNRIPWNDFYYSRLVEVWLPYGERLLKDSNELRVSRSRNPKGILKALGYTALAVETFMSKPRRSAVEFTCEWLASRGGIRMVKPREDPDIQRTLRNAYSRMRGRQMRRLFESIF